MLSAPSEALFTKLPNTVAPLIVYPVWIWLALRTSDVLRFATGKSIPFRTRTVWLAKILALVIGAGGMLDVPTVIGLSWYWGIVPASLVIFFSLREKVRDIKIQKPQHDASAYQAGWNEYRHLRANAARAYLVFGIVLIAEVIIARLGEIFAKRVDNAILVIAVLVLIASFTLIYSALWKLVHWPCPRCGCAIEGCGLVFSCQNIVVIVVCRAGEQIRLREHEPL